MTDSLDPFAEEAANPYQPPDTTEDAAVSEPGDDELIRRAHLNVEQSIKSIGTVLLVGGVLLALSQMSSLFARLPGRPEVRNTLILFGLVAAMLATAMGLRWFRPWARITACLLSAGFAIMTFPLGLLIAGYFLLTLLNGSASTVFTRDYQQVIARTPQIRYRTPMLVLVAFWTLVLVLLGVLLGFVG